MRKAWHICRRELAQLYGGPLAWVLHAVFALLAGYFFYSELTFFVLAGGANLPRGLWRFVFLQFRLVAMLVVPLLTMRLLAEERKLGTLELLWTLPVHDGEIIAGKFAAAYLAYLGMVATTLVGPVVLWVMHPFALAPIGAAYLGLLLLGAVIVACGLAASAVAENQVVAAMLTYGTIVFLWFFSWNEAAINEHLAPIARALSLFDRFYSLAQGVIDSRDVAILCAFVVLFLFLAHRALGSRSWRGIV